MSLLSVQFLPQGSLEVTVGAQCATGSQAPAGPSVPADGALNTPSHGLFSTSEYCLKHWFMELDSVGFHLGSLVSE